MWWKSRAKSADDVTAYQRGVEAFKLLDDPEKLADRVAYLERAVAEDATDHLSRKELDLLSPALKAEQTANLYTQAWADG